MTILNPDLARFGRIVLAVFGLPVVLGLLLPSPAEADDGLKRVAALYKQARDVKNLDCQALLRETEQVMKTACTKRAYAEARSLGAHLFTSLVCRPFNAAHIPIGYQGAHDRAKVENFVLKEYLAAAEYGSTWAPIEALTQVHWGEGNATEGDIRKAVHYLQKTKAPVVVRYDADKPLIGDQQEWDAHWQQFLFDIRESLPVTPSGASAAAGTAKDMTKADLAKMFGEAMSTNVYFEPIFVAPDGC
ncbi:MAG: hypothetical protein ACPGOY_02140 [Rhodospirillaceae bacterium]